MDTMYKLVLLRHGQSTWNLENRFTGWTDVGLTPQGEDEAHTSGKALAQNGFTFDIAYTSVLRRAVKTLWIVMEEMGLEWLPVINAWELNERHYGALQGLNKAEMAAKYGEEQVFIWRRSYDIQPPALTKSDARYPGRDPRYKEIEPQDVPLTESLKDTVVRFMPYWHEVLAPAIKSGKRVVISAHGNSLRALVKYLDNIPDAEIAGLNIPTGIPLVYELDDSLKPIRHYYLGSQEEVQKAMEAVERQGKAKC